MLLPIRHEAEWFRYIGLATEHLYKAGRLLGWEYTLYECTYV